jgi:aldehyde dehydrogenase (NAD+)
VAVAIAAAPTVKRVTQELGGKSANIILADADIERAVGHGVRTCMRNSGQSCNAPTRMFVPREHHQKACDAAANATQSLVVGDPNDAATDLGPLSNQAQWNKVQTLIQAGIDEGADLLCGGPGRPGGLAVGAYVRPTVFGNVTNDMTIARQEIFGPVLAILPYDTEDEAVALANDTEYGLSASVQSGDLDHAVAVGTRLRAGQVHLNGAPADFAAPFGGYKQSGNGREWGREGLEEFLEVKALMGAES